MADQHPKEEMTKCNECEKRIPVAEAEYHCGMCRDCLESNRRAMTAGMDQYQREQVWRKLDQRRH